MAISDVRNRKNAETSSRISRNRSELSGTIVTNWAFLGVKGMTAALEDS